MLEIRYLGIKLYYIPEGIAGRFSYKLSINQHTGRTDGTYATVLLTYLVIRHELSLKSTISVAYLLKLVANHRQLPGERKTHS